VGGHRGPVDLAVDVAGIRLRNPVVAASGTFGHGDEVARLGDPSAIGAVTVKSLAAFPWPGTHRRRLRTARPGCCYCRIRGQGPGVDAWVRERPTPLRALAARVIASVWGALRRRVSPPRPDAPAGALHLVAVERESGSPTSRTATSSSPRPGPRPRAVGSGGRVSLRRAGAVQAVAQRTRHPPRSRWCVSRRRSLLRIGQHRQLGLAGDSETDDRPSAGGPGGPVRVPPSSDRASGRARRLARPVPGVRIISGTGGRRRRASTLWR